MPRTLPRTREVVRRVLRVRLTARGSGTVALGGALAVGGVVLALPDLVGLGSAALLAVGATWVVTGVQRLDEGRAALTVGRTVAPDPVVRGHRSAVVLTVAARSETAAAHGRLARLRISEQAAHELSETEALRARVATRADRIDVRYEIVPSRRGRWPLGPLLTTRTDVFGLVRTTQPLGGTTNVTVWPRTVELAVRTRALGEVERAATGARLASSDDSILREYVAGDDPRRVHWASAARRGRLMVRADESAGVRPVTVLVDRGLLPAPDLARSRSAVDDGEWAVELAASVAVSFLEAGHPVRMVGTSTAPAVGTERFVVGRRAGRSPQLLDRTVDLQGHRVAGDAERATVLTAEALRADRSPGEITVAVVPPLRPVARRALAALATEGTHWAVVVEPRGGAGFQHELHETLDELQAAGWTTASTAPGAAPGLVWSLLTEGGR